jgi:ubiquinone/menaquinone biosynthesis C-methylase UbiE
MPTDHWRAEAENWAQFARSRLDAYWEYHNAFFDELVPGPDGLTIDIGCGEGRTTRDLAARRHRTVGVDASSILVGHARERDREGAYIVADAACLPFQDATFGVAVAFNSLMDVDDMPGSVSEAARVLKAGGHLCVCIVHPIADAGKFAQREAESPFVIGGNYLAKRFTDETLEREGVSMTFKSWCYPLQDYALAFEAAGFLVEALREPAAPDKAVEADPAERRWQRIPLFLFLRLLKPQPSLS